MRREVVQDFLNLPGIVGIALLDGRSRPYFSGVDQALNSQQKEALTQGIQQVVETAPTGFECFEFQFTGHQVYIYRLSHGIILLVFAGADLILQSYNNAIARLKTELETDSINAIATFRLLAGNITLSNQTYWAQRAGTVPRSTLVSLPLAQNSAPESDRSGADGGKASPSPGTAQPVSLQEVLAALNHCSRFTTQYLGTTVIANYWKSSCPDVEWLANFQVDRAAQFSFSGGSPPATLTPEQWQWIQDWVAAFIQRCTKVLRDLPAILEQRALDDHQKYLLLSHKP